MKSVVIREPSAAERERPPHFCFACKAGPEMAPMEIADVEMYRVLLCNDPSACRRRAERSGIWLRYP